MMRVNVSLFPSLGHGLTTFIISQFLLTLFLSSSMMPMLRPCVQILYWLLSGCSLLVMDVAFFNQVKRVCIGPPCGEMPYFRLTAVEPELVAREVVLASSSEFVDEM